MALLQEVASPIKGYIVLFDPITRTKQDRIFFMFNPNQLTVSYNPNYTFKTAPINANSYAQYGNSSPMTIKFDLFLRGSFVSENLAVLKRLVDNRPLRNPFTNPPLCKLYLGNALDWIGQSVQNTTRRTPVEEITSTVPIGVIDSMEIVINRQDNFLKPYEATVNLSFTESNVSALSTDPNL